MRKLSFVSSIFFMLLIVFGCENPAEEIKPEVQDELSHRSSWFKASKVTGFVQVEWKGKGGTGTVEDKLVFASFAAHESVLKSSKNKFLPAKGFFFFSVFKSDYTPERKIVAKVVDVGFGDPVDKKAWVFAKVISDSKCDTSDNSGCTDSDHAEGGCSHDDDDSTHDAGCSHDTGTEHDDTGTDGGCDHDDTETDEGCDHDDTETDTGCDHDDTETDGGCDHDDTGTEHDEGSGGKPDDKGGKGKKCRVGQYVVAKMHDKGSPGTMDGITWKWFNTLDGFSIDVEPQRLCKKTILKGNLTVHIPKEKKH